MHLNKFDGSIFNIISKKLKWEKLFDLFNYTRTTIDIDSQSCSLKLNSIQLKVGSYEPTGTLIIGIHE